MTRIQPAKETLEELYWEQGLSVAKIGALLGCHATRIHQEMKKLDIKRRSPKQKGLKIQKEVLEELYWKQGLSLEEVGKRVGCHSANIVYWMRKFGIETRPVDYREIKIPKEILEELYCNPRLSTLKIADILKLDHRLISKKLEKASIPTRTLSEALTKKFKAPFSGKLSEKAYFLGLRTGDFYAKKPKKSVRIQTTSTHTAQVDLLRNAVRQYGETKTYLSKNKARADEWFIYADLDESFDFLLNKPEEIPSRVLENQLCFYNFLCAYSDCEGSFTVVKSHKNSVRFIFKIKTGDKKILEQIKTELESQGYNPRFYLHIKKGSKKGFAGFNKDIYDLTIYRKKEMLRLIDKLLPLSKHSEKIRKMKYIQENKNKNWNEILLGWSRIKEEIKSELLKNCL